MDKIVRHRWRRVIGKFAVVVAAALAGAIGPSTAASAADTLKVTLTGPTVAPAGTEHYTGQVNSAGGGNVSNKRVDLWRHESGAER